VGSGLSDFPTAAPTAAPTDAPTSAPTAAPTDVPTDSPTYVLTAAPTAQPTDIPTVTPTDARAFCLVGFVLHMFVQASGWALVACRGRRERPFLWVLALVWGGGRRT
jgi:hypothetical protein